MGINYTPKIITDGLKICLDAGNSLCYSGSGSSMIDLTANNNTGSLINSPGFSSLNKGSISFDGTNDYLDTPLTYGGTNQCSYGCWMKAPHAAQKCGLIGFRSQFVFNAPEITQTLIYITGDNDAGTTGKGIVCQDWYAGYISGSFTFFNNRTVYALNTIVCNNQWHYIVVSRSSASTKLFVDNILVGETSGSIPSIKSDPIFKVGVAGNGDSDNLAGYYFTGNIALVHFYNRALSNNEVAQNYNANKGRFNL